MFNKQVKAMPTTSSQEYEQKYITNYYAISDFTITLHQQTVNIETQVRNIEAGEIYKKDA